MVSSGWFGWCGDVFLSRKMFWLADFWVEMLAGW